MQFDTQAEGWLRDALAGRPITKEECACLLQFPETALEASLLRAVADATSRERFQNQGIVLGQVGVEIAACPGKCKFCSFGEGHTQFSASVMSEADILHNATRFTASGELFALFLMTMHTFDFARLLHTVRTLRERSPLGTQLVVNIGDFDRVQALELKAAGVNGAYHVCRLREGTDTALDPERRQATIRTIRECGLDWYNCCEPIGPEHGPEELAEQIFLGLEYGCFQHAAMRRVYIPSAPLASRGQISELRLAQVVAVIALATLGCRETRSIAVHEPNLLGLAAGANTVYAETGANPRDTEQDTTGHRGRDMAVCKQMLYEAGFSQLLVSQGKQVSLLETFKS
jgi:biotin synthase